MVALAALLLVLRPSLPFVFAAALLQGAATGLLGPGIAAISLGLVGHAALSDRLGRNQSLASIGAFALPHPRIKLFSVFCAGVSMIASAFSRHIFRTELLRCAHDR